MTTLFRRFVQIGRVALVNFGRNEGKICVILDIIDQNRCLVDGPHKITGVPRGQMSLKRLSLTDIVVPKLPRGARKKTLIKKFTDAKIKELWEKTAWARKRARRAARGSMNDFERFQAMVSRQRRSKIIQEATKKLRKQKITEGIEKRKNRRKELGLKPIGKHLSKKEKAKKKKAERKKVAAEKAAKKVKPAETEKTTGKKAGTKRSKPEGKTPAKTDKDVPKGGKRTAAPGEKGPAKKAAPAKTEGKAPAKAEGKAPAKAEGKAPAKAEGKAPAKTEGKPQEKKEEKGGAEGAGEKGKTGGKPPAKTGGKPPAKEAKKQ